MPKTGTITVRGRLVGAARPSDIEVRGGAVLRVDPAGRRPADFGSRDAFIGPALFDIQVNGAAGHGLQGGQVRPDDVLAVTEHLAAWGVSHWVPTLITAPLEEMEHGCRMIAEALRDPCVARAVPGIHLEGPCISPNDGPRGAHPKAQVRPPKIADFDRLMTAAEGRILYTTLAPEWPGAPAYIRALVRRGVLAALGHHEATAVDIARAVDAGARLCTHLGNGSASLMKRHDNPFWPQLAEDRIAASLIADLHHLPAAALKTFVRAKGPARVILTSDCVRLAGMKPGKYREFGAEVELKRNGIICLSGTDLLAGSAMMLLQGVVNAWRSTDLTLEQAFACATTVPAGLFRVKRLSQPMGVGGRANFVVFEADHAKRRAVKVLASFVHGMLRG